MQARAGEPEHVYSANRIRFTFSERDARRVKVLLACDIDAKGIGEMVKIDLRRLREYFAHARESFPEVEFDIQSIFGSSLTAEKLKARIEAIETTPEDVLVLYYSGHGASDTSQVIGNPPGRRLLDSHYLNLTRGKIFRDEIREVMASKPHKLVVMLTNCCCNRDTVAIPGEGIGDGSLYMASGMEPADPPQDFQDETFRGLFLRCGGLVDLSAASLPTFTLKDGVVVAVEEGEMAACNDEVGGIFTHVLLRLLAKPPSELAKGSRYPNSVYVDWMQMFGKLQPGTYNYRVGLDGSVLQGVDRKDHAAVVRRLRESSGRIRDAGIQRPFFYELRGE